MPGSQQMLNKCLPNKFMSEQILCPGISSLLKEGLVDRDAQSTASPHSWSWPAEDSPRVIFKKHPTLKPAPTVESTSRELCLDLSVLQKLCPKKILGPLQSFRSLGFPGLPLESKLECGSTQHPPQQHPGAAAKMPSRFLTVCFGSPNYVSSKTPLLDFTETPNSSHQLPSKHTLSLVYPNTRLTVCASRAPHPPSTLNSHCSLNTSTTS